MSDNGEIDSKSNPSDEGHDEDFSVNAFLSPLGGGREDEKLSRSRTSTEEERYLANRERMQRKTFSITFESTNIPFEFTVNAEGYVVVSFVSKPIDSRLNRGVIVLGVDGELLPQGARAQDILEGLLEDSRTVPFSITFCTEEHEIDNYEEENSYGEESLDEEVHNSGSFEVRSNPDADIDALSEERHLEARAHMDEAEENGEEEDRGIHEASAERVPLTGAASLLKSGMISMSTTLASKYNHLRGNSGGDEQSTHEDETEEEEELDELVDEGDVFAADNMFDLLLPGRSPPFVFDLHADGSSVVVVKLVGNRGSMDPRLREGCVVRAINGRPVYCTCRQDFDTMLSAVDVFPLRMTLEHAPSLYRHQDALALFTEASADPAIHMFTVLPYKIGPDGQDAEGVFDTARRAKDVLQAFRAQGIAASLVSIETVLVRENASAYSGVLSTQSASQSYSSYVISSSQSVPLLRAIRVWFRFQEAIDIVVSTPLQDVSLLEVTKSGEDGAWIVIRCIGQSAWLDAGMVLGRPYLLTHVNGYDTSSSGYRSIDPRIPGDGSWEHSVLPFLHEPEVKFTLA